MTSYELCREVFPDSDATPTLIEVRCNSPEAEHDCLFGFCRWDGEKLISLDDDHYPDEPITKYDITGTLLTYWIEVDWVK